MITQHNLHSTECFELIYVSRFLDARSFIWYFSLKYNFLDFLPINLYFSKFFGSLQKLSRFMNMIWQAFHVKGSSSQKLSSIPSDNQCSGQDLRNDCRGWEWFLGKQHLDLQVVEMLVYDGQRALLLLDTSWPQGHNLFFI